MIYKLEYYSSSTDRYPWVRHPNSDDIVDKINELIDKVNELETKLSKKDEEKTKQ